MQIISNKENDQIDSRGKQVKKEEANLNSQTLSIFYSTNMNILLIDDSIYE